METGVLDQKFLQHMVLITFLLDSVRTLSYIKILTYPLSQAKFSQGKKGFTLGLRSLTIMEVTHLELW